MAPHRPEDLEEKKAQSTSWSAVNYLLRSGFSWSGHERNNLFVNLADGRFADVSHVGGVDFADDARGVAALDWDQDGDLDLWLNNRSSPKARLMRNEHAARGRGWRLGLVGTRSNRDAVGARVSLRLADGRSLVRTVRAGVNYTVQGSKWLHFGLGGAAGLAGLDVRWPSGTVTRHEIPQSGDAFVLIEGEDALREYRLPTAPTRLESQEFHVEPLPRTASVPLGRPLEIPSDLAMTDFAGESHQLADYGGEPLLINLWASWCVPCRTEFADFEEHRRALTESGLSILACSVDEDPEAAAAAAQALGVRFPAGMCDERLLGLVETVKKAVFDQYEELALPTSLLLDGAGRLARVYVGPANAVQLAADVRALRGAEGSLEALELAAMTEGGRWERPEIWLASQQGKQLMQMTQFLSRENRGGLLTYYATALADYLDAGRPPERALATATSTLLEAGQTLAVDAPATAIGIFRRLLRHRADDAQVHWNLAWSLLETEGRSPEAHRVVDAALKLAPEPASSQRAAFRGLVLQRLGRPEQAVPELERALAGDPLDETVQAALAAVRAEVQRAQDSLAELEVRLASSPDDPAVVLALAKLLDSRRRPEEARAHYERYVAQKAELAAAEDAPELGRAYFRLERWDEAASRLAPVVEADPQRHEERRILGVALARSGRDAAARSHLEAAVAASPGDPATEYLLGIVRARVGDLAAAVESFERVLELRPDHLEASKSLALAYDNLGRPELAIEQFRRYLEVAPRDFEARRRLAKNLEIAKRTDEAIDTYRATLEMEPNEASARYRLAWLLATNSVSEYRDGPAALEMAKKLNTENPRHAALLDLLAAAYAETGRFDEAARLADEASELARSTGDDALADQIGSRRELYASGRPFHGAS